MMPLKVQLKYSLLALAFLMVFGFALSCKSEPKKTEVVMNYITGEVSRRYETINGKKEGLMRDFHQDGTLKAERFFENDMQVGKTTIYHKNGKIREVQYFKDGKLHGGDTTFYDDGKPEMVITFNTGNKDGYLRKWGPDGSLIYEAKYENEVLVEVKGQPIKKDSIPPVGEDSLQ